MNSTIDVTTGDVVSENSAPPEIIIENLADAIDDETIDNSEETLETPPLPDNSDSSLIGLTNNDNNVVVSDVVALDRENVDIIVHEPSDHNDEVEVELTSLFADDDHEEVIFDLHSVFSSVSFSFSLMIKGFARHTFTVHGLKNDTSFSYGLALFPIFRSFTQ